MKTANNDQWKTDEVNYRLMKIVLLNLMHDGLITESEMQQILQELRCEWSPLIARIEEND